jgi:hypothetical protein
VPHDEPSGSGRRPDDDAHDLRDLAAALGEVGTRVRDAVRAVSGDDDHRVVRHEGGDHIYGIDARAEQALFAGLGALGRRWPGRAIVEGHDHALTVGDGSGPWTYLVDPVDGTRPLLAGKRSAWVLLGAGRHARTLEDLEVGAMVEVPTARAAVGRVAWAVAGARPEARDDDLVTGGSARPIALQPRHGSEIDHTFVTVVRLLPGDHAPIGAWADRHLAGLQVWDDLVPCTGGFLAGLASGADTAVLDPRPLLSPGSLPAHPYDLASLVVARAAGVVVEALPPGPLDVPLDTTTPVAWAGYANDEVAARLRPTDPIG